MEYWQRNFEVVAEGTPESIGIYEQCEHALFQQQVENMAKAGCDAADEVYRVRGFEDHRSTVLSWLRETGIVDHPRRLKKDEIRAAITLPPPDDDGYLRVIIDANQALLHSAHQSCFDGPGCMLT